MWIYLDRNTPSQELVKTAELPPSQNYVLGSHPHGVMSTGAFCNFTTDCNDFSQRFPGLQPWLATLAGLFYLPVFRDYIMASGHSAASSLFLAPPRASLVPVYSFGVNDTFKGMNFSKGSWQYLCQVTCKRVTSIAPCIFWGRGLFLHNSCGLLPLPMPITTVVGGPIPVPQCSSPSQEQVDHYHRLYMDALERLFEEHKESCGVPASTHLTFL
nr:2-acylglycerol O-acyltransferase 3-like [Oryctolagus cuniculus]